MPHLDALKQAIAGVVRAVFPRIDYACPYGGRVVKYGGGLVDVALDDPSMPSMSGVPLRHGIPGLVIDAVAPGTSVIVAFSESDPARPYASLWSGSEGGVAATWSGQLSLGGPDGEPPPLGNTYRQAEDTYLLAISSGTQAALTGLGLSSAAAAVKAADNVWKLASPTFLAKNVKVT